MKLPAFNNVATDLNYNLKYGQNHLAHRPLLDQPREAVVVSDLHIGLPYFRKEAFMKFIGALHDRTALILNGDIVDNPHRQLDPQDQAVLDFLVAQSFQRRVVWIFGNHDEDFRMADPGEIEFRRSLALDTWLMVVHGDDFDTIMPRNRWFLWLFKFCHKLRIRMGADPVHVAELAKRWAPLLYRVLNDQVRKNAVDCALEGGFQAIACGHTHYAEDSTYKGVRYINTGAWTEEPFHYISIRADEIHLANYAEG